jgi:ankyrin repeat protein
MKATALPVGIPLLSAVVVLGWPSRAESCSCGPPLSVLEARDEAKAVFLGVVVSMSKPVLGSDGDFGPLVFRFRVSRAWKGVRREVVDVRTAGIGTACGYFFKIGEEYLVYAYEATREGLAATGAVTGRSDDLALWTSMCSRTMHFRNAEQGDLRQLGAPAWVGPTEGSELSEELLRASMEGKTDEVRRLVAAGNDVNGRDRRYGTTPLKAAAAAGHGTTVKVLLAAGAEVNAVKGGSTALDDAVVGRHPEVVKLLIGAGARPGTFSLSFAAGGPPEVVEALLARGAPVRGAPGREALVAAALHDDTPMARRLVEAGADTGGPAMGQSALDAAVSRGNSEMVSLLLAAGARPSQKTLDDAVAAGRPEVQRLVAQAPGAPARPGPAALVKAAGESNIAGIELALAAGVDVNALAGDTALVHAARSGAVEGVRRLLKAGANPNLPGGSGVLPLSAAAMSGRVEILGMLLAAGARIEGHSSVDGADHGTALRWAVSSDRVENVAFLLKAGARPDAPFDGILYGTILAEAVGRGRVDVARLLLAAGADVNARRMIGVVAGSKGLEAPPLTVAASRGSAAMVEALLEAGASVDVRDGAGRTALERAQEAGNTAAIEVLRKAGRE